MIADFLSSVFNATLENPRFSLNDPEAYEYLTGGRSTEAGITVTPEKAMQIAAVWQAATMISGDVSLCTPNVHVRGDDAEIDEKHPAEWIIAYEWNEETPQDEGWERLALHALIWGNGYAYIERAGGSRTAKPIAMYNLLPDRTAPHRLDSGQLAYITQVDGKPEVLYPEEVFHLKGPSTCNDEGMNLVNMAREAFALSLAAQNFSSKFFANGSQSAGILEIPVSYSDTAAKNLEEGFSKRTSGSNNWFKTVILRDGAKFHSTTIDAQKSQTGELRDAQVREAARFFKMPPSMLGVQDSVSYNSQEQARLAYKQQCLAHWLKRLRGQAEMKLLTREERRGKSRYIDHNVTKLIETDAKSMAEILQIERNAEVINANEWRRKINMPKRKDPGGEEYINPNTKSAGSGGTQSAVPESDPATTGSDGVVPAESTVGAAATGDIQATALNGAQIGELVGVADKLAADMLPKEGVRSLIEASFPLMDKSLINKMVEDIAKFMEARRQQKKDSPAVTPAAKAVAVDAINRMARRVCFDATNAAKKPAELCQWLDSRAQVHRETFQQAVRPSANLVASMLGCDGETLAIVWEGKFFAGIVSRIEPLTNPPHIAADLARNVDEQCRQFTATVAEELFTSF